MIYSDINTNFIDVLKEIKPYYEPKQILTDDDELTLINKIRTLTQEKINDAYMSDVPIGIFLSGGVDSSYVSKIISQNRPEQIQTFSLRFSNKWTDEANLAMLHASEIGSLHHEVIFNDNTLDFYLNKIYEHLDEPMANSSSSNTLYISC